MTPFRVIVADPPWRFDDNLPGDGRGAAKHYKTIGNADMPHFLEDQAIEVAENAILFMWRVAALVPEAYRVVEGWGFVAKSEITWIKTDARGRKLSFGMGRYVRHCHETAIIATRGGAFAAASHSIRSCFEAPIGRHSEKPERFYELVEQLAGGGPYLELFARRRREGWTCLGDELR